MNEARWVLLAFGMTAFVMIALPVATVWNATRPGPPEKGIDGEISRAFLASPQEGPPSIAWQPVGGVSQHFPKGMPEQVVFEKFAGSGFICATDSDAATCFRSHADSFCREEWKVRVIFKDDGTVWSNKAERSVTCL